MPISRTRNDYIISGVVVVLLAGAGVLSVYATKPNAIIMRQPRMTVAIALTVIMLISAFIFIARPALPFFSRPLAWGAVIASAIGMGAVGFFTSAGTDGSWFRFFVLCLVISLGGTVLAEVMIFYRRFIAEKAWRTAIWHRAVFAIAIAALTLGMGYFYYEKGVSGGAVIDYGVTAPISDIPNTVDPTTELPEELNSLTTTAVPGVETTVAPTDATTTSPNTSETTSP